MLHFASEKKRALLARKLHEGKLVRLAPGIYSDDLLMSVEDQIREPSTLHAIVSARVKRVRLAYKSALEWPYFQGNEMIFVGEHDHVLRFENTSVVFQVFKGSARELSKNATLVLAGDDVNGLVLIPRIERAILENFSTRSVDQRKINRKLAESRLRDIVDKSAAKKGQAQWELIYQTFSDISRETGLEKEADQVFDFLNQWQAEDKKAASVVPYDWNRVKDFENLARELDTEFLDWHEESEPLSPKAKRHQALFESYFSNYIEGTELEIQHALNVMEDRSALDQTHLDEHDVRSTFRAILDDTQSPPVLNLEDAFLSQLKGWHQKLFNHRAEAVGAGAWKRVPNRVGQTFFVEPALTEGTLARTFAIAKSMTHPVAKAFFLKLAFVNVHPFEDGNGRVSRLLMNTLLAQAGARRLVLPTVLREDYLLSLGAWSNRQDVKPFRRFLNKLRDINQEIPWAAHPDEIMEFLDSKAAFNKPHEAQWGKRQNHFNSIGVLSVIQGATSGHRPRRPR